jgi:glucose/arabinose dehydrogenase
MRAKVFYKLLLVLAVFSMLSVHVKSSIHANAASAFDPTYIVLQETASGLTQPLFITNAGDGSGHLFVVERAGRIRIIDNGTLLPTPYLDIQSIVNSAGGEQGLLALAFHPNYETNGWFYTVHTDQDGSLILSRFTRSSTNSADPNSRITLLAIPHPTYQNHNGGTLAFGPDGYLYWSTGDGGSGGDPSNNAQNLNVLLGKILRLDVDHSDPGLHYSIPVSNPFYNTPNRRGEIWAYGLRNPWRISFDRQTGDLFIGDVGQNAREEIDFQAATSTGGENYGWRIMEGTACYNPSTGCDQSGKVLPVAEYTHSLGCSVTGGYIYRGSLYPLMQGRYFFSDFCSGILFSLYKDPGNGWTTTQIADTPYSVSTFGQDEAGELFLADYSQGKIYQICYGSKVETYVATAKQGQSSVCQTARQEYTGLNSGPIKVVSTDSINIISSQRVIYGGMSYSEMMGFPAEQLAKEYLFPYYNNVAMDSQLRVSNVGGAATTITVYLAGNPIDQYTLAAGAATRKNYTGRNSGPLRVTSSASNILTTVRVLYGGNSYSELMGLPTGQLTQEYLFPYYNNVAMNSQLRVSNVGGADTTINVYLGSDSTPIDSYTLAAGGATRKNYPNRNSGPLRVTSSASNILTSIRVLYAGNSYSELMGFPTSELEQEYWYPVYDNTALDSQLRVSNVGSNVTTITVYAGGTQIDSYSLNAGATTRKNYPKNTGPLHVVSSSQPILSTIRLLYGASYYEMTGLPNSKLSTQYFFPWYNNTAMSSELRFAIP